MTKILIEKTAVITGSTRGIGLGIARALSDAGANVVLNGFGDVLAARALIEQAGGKVAYHGADLRHPEQIADLMHYAEKEFGSIDILVNNAGIQHIAPIEEFSIEHWNNIIALNLSAGFHTTRLAVPVMKKNNWGRIINIVSVHGLVASSNKSAYIASKHGMIGLTKSVALELAKTGITCNAICPGWVLTSLVEQQITSKATLQGISYTEAQSQLLLEKQPSGVFVTPEQIGALLLFLCSDAAEEVRGAAWNIDGGWIAQ
ncbi:3-hydroxybutyrate dehydrogenase [Iodobacter ciconiae]|uniref:3-hydroxybutyrate dehydrogenase n=1 Tax=Iodobacter ciconiae TaxID=2496266 RepID=A0A3S8ZSK8_9NEIS|nr:3-hydroxybutyrate dehydrogenase [Iodobacter ciconiae]AZN36434.1 3-hydroxybutyrate dehydrogenase [Iodobacter ciconiae]